jgi:hypothetical protein
MKRGARDCTGVKRIVPPSFWGRPAELVTICDGARSVRLFSLRSAKRPVQGLLRKLSLENTHGMGIFTNPLVFSNGRKRVNYRNCATQLHHACAFSRHLALHNQSRLRCPHLRRIVNFKAATILKTACA